jgi:hypothetical protein
MFYRWHEMDDRENPPKRRGKFRAVATELPKITRPILGKRGLGEAQLLLYWETIVGAELADSARPERLAFERGGRTHGTLRLRVAPAAAVEIQHQAPVIVERVNAFLGYPAVERVSYVQAPLTSSRTRPVAPRALRPEEQEILERKVAAVDDEELRAALERLGAAVMRSGDA